MNEELQKTLIENADFGKIGIKKGLDLMQQQAPEIIEQIIIFNLFENILYAFLSFLLVMPCIYGCCFFIKKQVEDEHNPWFIGAIVSFFALLKTSAVFLPSFVTLLKICVAPNLYLIEYLTTFIK